MSDKFVPFAPAIATAAATAAAGSEPFRVTVSPAGAANSAASTFRPVTAIAPALSEPPAPPSAPSPSAHTPAVCAAGNPSTAPQVTLVRDGDRITLVRVQCACGEVIELQCVY